MALKIDPVPRQLDELTRLPRKDDAEKGGQSSVLLRATGPISRAGASVEEIKPCRSSLAQVLSTRPAMPMNM